MTDSVLMSSDLSDLCRVCLQMPEESQYLDLSTIYDEDDHLTYSDCFMICTQIDLKAGIGVPHHLCKPCGLELQMSYDFHKKIEESKRVIAKYEKHMQATASEQEFLPQNAVKIEQDKDPDEEQLNDDIQYPQSSKVVKETHCPQTQKVHKVTQNEQEYLLDSDDENSVELLSKIGSMKNDDNDEVAENEHAVSMDECIEIEEHLEMDDFQNLETLEEEETETIQIESDENMIPMLLTKYKNVSITDKECYLVETVRDENSYHINLKEELLVDEEEENSECLKWQENVVAVANKEHLPVENEENVEAAAEGEFGYLKDEDYVVINEASGDEIILEVGEKKPKKSAKKKQKTIKVDESRKRRVGSHACDVCQKMFPNYSRMMSHRRFHDVDRIKYGCQYCGRLYATKQTMESHVKTAHEKSGYPCIICNKVFAIRQSLKIHVRYHTGDFPYVCDLCGKKFAQAGHLNTHKNVKHNSMRFSCNFAGCVKVFTSSTSLRSHEYTHGIMPFECEFCQQGYPAKTKLRVHIKRKHGKDMNVDELEHMRKFHVMRSKLNVVKVLQLKDKDLNGGEE